ncbi:MAG: hypothetical protein IKB73_05285 [Ruminococcus sp.]|nr:hypothetical protein [Ruminococcus sp.]
MLTMYYIGYYLGRMIIGAIIGIIPLVVCCIKGNKTAGIIGIIFCALISAYKPILAVFSAIVFTVLALVPKEKK